MTERAVEPVDTVAVARSICGPVALGDGDGIIEIDGETMRR